MQLLDLNLASRPFKNNTLLWLCYGLALVLVAVFTTWNVQTYGHHKRLLSDLRAELSQMTSQFNNLDVRDVKARGEVERHDLKMLRRQADKANEVIRWKAFSWTGLFNLLEQIQPHDVRMTSVHPVFHDEQQGGEAQLGDSRGVPVSVEGLAKDHQAILKLEVALMRDVHILQVEPDKTEREEATNQMVFRLHFLYDHQAEPEAVSAPAEPEGESTQPGTAVATEADDVAGRSSPNAALRADAGVDPAGGQR